MTPEFSRPVRADDVGTSRLHAIAAEPEERVALAARFDLLALDRLEARLTLSSEAAGIRVTGSVAADGAQPCGLSGVPVAFRLEEPVTLLFTVDAPEGDEIELADADLDREALVGDVVDLGEIAAQSLALGLDPYPRARGAAAHGAVIDEVAARRRANPFSVLRGNND